MLYGAWIDDRVRCMEEQWMGLGELHCTLSTWEGLEGRGLCSTIQSSGSVKGCREKHTICIPVSLELVPFFSFWSFTSSSSSSSSSKPTSSYSSSMLRTRSGVRLFRKDLRLTMLVLLWSLLRLRCNSLPLVLLTTFHRPHTEVVKRVFQFWV